MPKLNLVTPEPLLLDQFRGLWNRGIHDTVPKGYAQDILNVTLQNSDEVKTRNGTDSVFSLPDIRRIALYKRLNETPRYLVLDTNGNFYDSLYGPPLITNVAFLDFSMVNYNNRAYITFHNRVNGVGSGVYVYQGDGTIRLAAGSAPSAFTLGADNSATSGTVEAGIHLFAVAFETDSGFITAPGPAVFAQLTATGNLAVDISNIPVGPAGTTARWILATRVIPDYDGNQFGYEFFFVPEGRIGNNVDTTLTIDFFDADLLVSADYLFDLISTIPAGSSISVFNNRLVVGGISGDAHTLYVSRQNDVETFDSTLNVLTVDPSEATSGITNTLEFRNSLMIAKGNRFYTTTDSDADPVNWGVPNSLDEAIGTQCFGIAAFLDDKTQNTDRFFVADPGGVFVFESGLFRRPAFSYNIEDTWKRINKAAFNKVQLALDAENQVLYCAVPLDAATEISHLLVAYFSDTVGPYGFISPKAVRWSIFTFPYRPSSILVDVNTSGKAVLKFGSLDDDIYQINEDDYLDTLTAISSYYEFGLVQQVPGWVHQFTKIHLRVKGTGSLDFQLKGEDNVLVQTITNGLTIATSPGREYARKINFINEKMSLKIGTLSVAGNFFNLFSVIIEAKPKWKSRVE